MERKLHEIIAPGLTDVAFGRNIREQFENINDNFKILANHDFIKGDRGESILYKEIKISDDSILLNEVKKIINPNNIGVDDIYTDQGIISWEDNFENLSATIFCEEKTGKYISSLPILFLDARFNTNFLKKYFDKNKNEISITEAYKGKIDLSCVLYIQYTKNNYEVIKTNTWPQLYYDTDINDFCWIYQGQETSLPARGPKGDDQIPIQNMFNVRADIDSNGNGIITHILYEGGWIPIKTYIDNINNKGYPKINNYSLVVVFKNINPSQTLIGEYWISLVFKNNDQYKVNCNDSNSIKFIFNANTINDILNTTLPVSDKNILKTLHLPSTDKDPETKTMHCIFASHPEGNSNSELKNINIGSILEYNINTTGSNWMDNPIIDNTSKLNIWNETNFKNNVNIIKDLIIKDKNIYKNIELLEDLLLLPFNNIEEINNMEVISLSETPDAIIYNSKINRFVYRKGLKYYESCNTPKIDYNKLYNTSADEYGFPINKILFNIKDKNIYLYDVTAEVRKIDSINNIINKCNSKSFKLFFDEYSREALPINKYEFDDYEEVDGPVEKIIYSQAKNSFYFKILTPPISGGNNNKVYLNHVIFGKLYNNRFNQIKENEIYYLKNTGTPYKYYNNNIKLQPLNSIYLDGKLILSTLDNIQTPGEYILYQNRFSNGSLIIYGDEMNHYIYLILSSTINIENNKYKSHTHGIFKTYWRAYNLADNPKESSPLSPIGTWSEWKLLLPDELDSKNIKLSYTTNPSTSAQCDINRYGVELKNKNNNNTIIIPNNDCLLDDLKNRLIYKYKNSSLGITSDVYTYLANMDDINELKKQIVNLEARIAVLESK